MFNQQSEVMWADEGLLTQDEDTDESVLIAVREVKVHLWREKEGKQNPHQNISRSHQAEQKESRT